MEFIKGQACFVKGMLSPAFCNSFIQNSNPNQPKNNTDFIDLLWDNLKLLLPKKYNGKYKGTPSIFLECKYGNSTNNTNTQVIKEIQNPNKEKQEQEQKPDFIHVVLFCNNSDCIFRFTGNLTNPNAKYFDVVARAGDFVYFTPNTSFAISPNTEPCYYLHFILPYIEKKVKFDVIPEVIPYEASTSTLRPTRKKR